MTRRSAPSYRGLLAAAGALVVVAAAWSTALLIAPRPSTSPATPAGAAAGPHIAPTPGSSVPFDVRQLPQLSAKSGHDRDKLREKHAPDAHPVGTAAFARIGSGLGGPSVPAPPTDTSFEGLAYSDTCGPSQCGDGHPPDTNGDVGPTYYIEVVNTAIGIFDKSTGSRVAAFTFDAFMSRGSFGNLCDTDNFGDPVVLYDTFQDRWFITDFAFQVDRSGNIVNPPGSFQCIAVSKSGDPVSGGWNYYSIHLTDGLQDYPKFGIWPDGIYMSANMFDYSAAGSYHNVRVWALDKARMYAGQAASVITFDAPATVVQGGTLCDVFTLLPSDARAQTGTPPAGRPNLFASTWCPSNGVLVWKFHVDWTTPGNSTFTGPTTSSTGSSWSPGPDLVPAKNGNDVDTLGSRTMAQNHYTNLNGVESLWDSHTVAGADGTQAAVRWYQVPVTGGTVGSALQASTFNPDTDNRFMPSVAVDRLGDMAIGYSVASATLYPSIRYAGRLAGDAANAITQTEATLIAGTGAQTGSCGGGPCERWGDYSAMTLDPNGCSFWYANEYYTDLSLNDHTRIGSFRFAGCTDVQPYSLAPAVASASAGQGKVASYTINITRSSFAGTIAFSASGLPPGASATFSPNPSSGSSAALSVTTSNCGTVTPRGTYAITVKGTSGGLTQSTSVSLTVTNSAPTLSTPVATLYGGTTLGSTTARVTTSWSACDADGIKSYVLQRQVNGGAWAGVSLPTATTTAINQGLTFGTTYRFRVVATDKTGVATSYVYGSSFKPIVSDNTSTAIRYAGSWGTATSGSYYGGHARDASAAGASATFWFTGSSVAWITYKSTGRGSATIYVDGVLRATVSLYSTTTTAKAQVYAFNWATSGSHSIRIVVAGTAGHPRVDVDAFLRLAPG
ncbi:MAG TPA: fibronectin type III domain-containing protein [Candidatus Dormibacteraeota bacterium]|nr:fibronectin type III domain-containing protein [Candidatus Dormibacteraeota bacterium]